MSKKYSISVSSKTYQRLGSYVSGMSWAKFIDGIVTSALDDPTIRDRVLQKCREKKVQP